MKNLSESLSKSFNKATTKYLNELKNIFLDAPKDATTEELSFWLMSSSASVTFNVISLLRGCMKNGTLNNLLLLEKDISGFVQERLLSEFGDK